MNADKWRAIKEKHSERRKTRQKMKQHESGGITRD
jgi:hypothetical protein